MDRRAALAALGSLTALPVLGAPATPGPGWKSVRAFGARGDGRTDDSGAFQEALDRAPGVWVPPGRYLVGDLVIRSHTRLRGSGAASRLLHRANSPFLAAINPGSNGSADPRDNARAIAIEDLAFEGRSATEGFIEHVHLLVASACSRLSVARCSFRAFQGDGIYIGSGTEGNVERHNEDIAVRGCVFDGVNFANRQGISIIDGTRIAIEDNAFRNCSRHDMPGAIDIEPDENRFHVIRDIRIARNRFTGVGGFVGAVCLILPIPDFTVAPRGFTIVGNRIDGRFRTQGIVAKGFVDAASQPPLDLIVAGNEIVDTVLGFELDGVRGVRFERNLIRNTLTEPVVSMPRRGCSADVRIAGNRFERLAMHTGRGLALHPTTRLTVSGNTFDDCGWLHANGGSAISLDEYPRPDFDLDGNSFLARGFRRAAVHLKDDPAAMERRLRDAGNRFGPDVDPVDRGAWGR